jgi:hypothetical protein
VEAAEKRPRRRGRPALPPDEGKRFNLGIKTTKDLKERIEAVADAAGRSVAEEIERRLWLSFELQDFRFLLELATAYNSNQEWGIVHAVMRHGSPDDQERWRRWHSMATALMTYRANHPIPEMPLDPTDERDTQPAGEPPPDAA